MACPQAESREQRLTAARQGPPLVHHRYYHTLAAAELGYTRAVAELQQHKARVVLLAPPRELCADGALDPVRNDTLESLSPEVLRPSAGVSWSTVAVCSLHRHRPCRLCRSLPAC